MGKTFCMFPEPGAWGPTNNLVALSEVLRDRGHRCVFVVDEGFTGVLEARGFEEARFHMAEPPPAGEEGAAGEVWVEYIKSTAPEFAKPTYEQLTTVIRPIWEELVNVNRYAHDRLTEIFTDEIRPDVIVQDNVSAYPAVVTAGRPWVRMVSCNPLEIGDPDLPPVFSGYSVLDRSGWDDFRAHYLETHADLHERYSASCVDLGADPLPAGEFQYVSPHLNLYLYADDADYTRRRPLDQTWHRLNASVRTGDAPFSVDERLPGSEPVVYLSLGSLGSLDVALMQRLIDCLAQGPYRVIVSMGDLADQLRLHPNMYGEAFLPQPSILPQCDLLITHGGNNTFNEGLHFGLPMIGLPLFWDQYDNAQRLADTGFGRRLPTYAWVDDDLLGAVDQLLADEPLRARMRAAAARIQSSPGRIVGADLLERLAERGHARP